MKADRNNADKPPMYYLLTFGQALAEVAYVCAHGEREYSRYNYLKGAPESEHASSLMRHLLAHWSGERVDSKSGRPHLAHAAWNMLRWLAEDLTRPGGYEADARAYTILPPPLTADSELPTAPPPCGKDPAEQEFVWSEGANGIWSDTLTGNDGTTYWLHEDRKQHIEQRPEQHFYRREDNSTHSTWWQAANHIPSR